MVDRRYSCWNIINFKLFNMPFTSLIEKCMQSVQFKIITTLLFQMEKVVFCWFGSWYPFLNAVSNICRSASVTWQIPSWSIAVPFLFGLQNSVFEQLLCDTFWHVLDFFVFLPLKKMVSSGVFLHVWVFLLCSSSKDTLVKWWDLDTQHCFKTLVGHRAEVKGGCVGALGLEGLGISWLSLGFPCFQELSAGTIIHFTFIRL